MKPLPLLCFLSLLQLLPISALSVEKETLLTRINEFHGETVETIYSPKNSDKTVYKIIFFYDEEFNIRRKEVYLTDHHSFQKGYYKMVVHYNRIRLIEKKELFLRDFLVDKKGSFKTVIHYDPTGAVISEENYDQLGNVVPK